MQPLFIAFNQGLGDCINYASLVVQFAVKQPVIIACKKRPGQRYKENAESFFIGYDVTVIECETHNDVYKLIAQYPNNIRLEEYSEIPYTSDRHIEHTKQGYIEAGLVYEDREKYCPIAKIAKEVNALFVPHHPSISNDTIPFAFIPEGGSECKFKIDRKYVDPSLKECIPPQNTLLIGWSRMIYLATEIHCHDTSWPWLIDKIPTTGKLFFHRYARKFDGKILPYKYDFQKPWQFIDEPEYISGTDPVAPNINGFKYDIFQRGKKIT